MTSEARLCIDCKWHSINPGTWSSRARHKGQRCNFKVMLTDVVTGEKYPEFSFSECYLLRESDGYCGPEGKNWEVKDDQ